MSKRDDSSRQELLVSMAETIIRHFSNEDALAEAWASPAWVKAFYSRPYAEQWLYMKCIVRELPHFIHTRMFLNWVRQDWVLPSL